jgi:hypothetical protein
MKSRGQVAPGVVLVTVGLIGLYNVTSKPRFETFHTVDVLQLIVTGMCFGVALGMLIMFFRGRHSH